jgi:hypothetical protein
MSSSPVSKKELLKCRIKEKAVGNRIPCALLRRIAEEAGCSYREAGEMANELGIKIRDCELGCF